MPWQCWFTCIFYIVIPCKEDDILDRILIPIKKKSY